MRIKNNFLSLIVIGLICLGLVFSGCTSSEKKEEKSEVKEPAKKQYVTIASAGTGGAFYPIAAGMAEVISKNVSNVEASAQVTGGAVENVKLVGKGQNELGISSSAIGYNGYNGKAPFTEKYENVNTLFSGLMISAMQIVVHKDSPIKTVADLKGKRLCVGPSGGGGLVFLEDLFGLEGFTLEDVKANYTSYDDGITSLKDKNLDGVCIASALPAAGIQQLAAGNKDFRILTIDKETIAKLQKNNPYYAAVEIPAKVYGFEADATTIGIPNIVVVNKNLDEELVYQITKALFENIDAIKASHPAAKDLSLEEANKDIVIPLHPGAKKYFDEKGV